MTPTQRTRTQSFFQTPTFWICFVLASLIALSAVFKYFPQAFPIVSLDLRMDRSQAQDSAQELAQKYGWGPAGHNQVAVFDLDSKVQHFVELAAGGNAAFAQMLKDGLYNPYQWKVRHFKAHETNETEIRFTADGTPYGFTEKIPEDQPGNNIRSRDARTHAEQLAAQDWGINFDEYELVETSQKEQLGGRIDHKLVYERPDVTIGEGRYRLKLVVSGDKLTKLKHIVKVPESFTRRYQEMRAANNSIATAGQIALYLLYILGGCVFGLLFLLRKRYVLWRSALLWAVGIATLYLLAQANELPVAWFSADTALSDHVFLTSFFIGLINMYLLNILLFFLSFAAAESLTRKAFGEHPQFWQLWSRKSAPSTTLLGTTIAGYVIVSFELLIPVATYFFARHFLGWWKPSNALIDPNVLSTYLPWLTSVAFSLHAGFWEECITRAIPFSCAALLGRRYKKERLFIGIAMVLQAIIFGALHANYVSHPSYARLVELILPSFVFGAIYLRFGLLPGIISHFVYDVFWYSLPLFVSAAPSAFANRLLVIFFTLVPLWIVLWQRIKQGAWTSLPASQLNSAWEPKAATEKKTESKTAALSWRLLHHAHMTQRIIVAGGVALIAWFAFVPLLTDAPSLTIGRSSAIELAQEQVRAKGFDLSGEWQPLVVVTDTIEPIHRFVWQEGGEVIHRELLGSLYLRPPRFVVRFVRFDVPVAERAEEYQVAISEDGDVIRYRHLLPEGRAGKTLSEKSARTIAHKALQDELELNPATLKELSATSNKCPQRLDWTFTFENSADYPLAQGQGRISIMISGDEVSDLFRYVHVPEVWARADRENQQLNYSFKGLCSFLLKILLLLGALLSATRASRGKFKRSFFLYSVAGILIINCIAYANMLPLIIGAFNTSAPFANQLFMHLAITLIRATVASAAVALIITAFTNARRHTSRHTDTTATALGFALGALATAVIVLMEKYAPSLKPLWAEYESAGCFVPLLAIVLESLTEFIMTTALFMLIINYLADCTRFLRARFAPAQTVLFLTLVSIALGTALVGSAGIDHLSTWLVTGFVAGLLLLCINLVIGSEHLELVPAIAAAYTVLRTMQQGLSHAYPTVFVGSLFASALIIFIAYHWVRICRHKTMDM